MSPLHATTLASKQQHLQLLPPKLSASSLQEACELFAQSPQCWPGFLLTVDELAETGDEGAARWLDLCFRLQLETREQQCLALLFVDPEPNPGNADFGPQQRSSLDPLWLRHSKLARTHLLSFSTDERGFVHEVYLQPECIEYLRASAPDLPSEALEDVELALPNSIARAVASSIRRLVEGRRKEPRTPIHARASRANSQLAVCGPAGSGRSSVAQHLATALGRRGLYRLELPKALALDEGDERIRRACTMAALGELAILVEGLEDCTDARRWCYRLCEAATGAWPQLEPLTLIWKLSATPPDWLELAPEHTLRLTLPNRSERLALWTSVCRGELPEPRLSELAGRFLLSQGQIAHAASQARASLASERAPSERRRFEQYCEAARAEGRSGLGALAQAESNDVRLDSLILSDENQSLLDELLSYLQHRQVLANELGFAESIPYGLGVTALFSGPPGTGKSHAASAIARVLGLEVYRVDLSQLVSKYIGETEKHLGQLFDAAQGGEIILLFDEADAIFAKRTEVKSSVDRYANLEVGYLLQRIERFDGLVILTTNHEASIDEAFQRRIRFRIAFEQPDAAARERLWRKLVPARLPLGADVDFEQLAQDYELSGGHIKEVVLRAAALALGEAGGQASRTCVIQQHFLRSVEAEYRKLGKLQWVAEGHLR
ncbi:MAG: ATP-binding protein [Myxococcota bacterium]|nr:ATP-binding protein [Myxococcota bacterium]